MRPSSAGARSGGSGGVCVNVSYCKYAVVREAASGLGYALVDDQEDTATPFNCFWWDVGVGIDKVMALRAHQRINHWPGMSCLHTKTGLAATLRPRKLRRESPRSPIDFSVLFVIGRDGFSDSIRSTSGRKRLGRISRISLA